LILILDRKIANGRDGHKEYFGDPASSLGKLHENLKKIK
jgi:hypothetical protein